MVPLLQIQVGEISSHFTQMVCEGCSNQEGARFEFHIMNETFYDFSTSHLRQEDCDRCEMVSFRLGGVQLTVPFRRFASVKLLMVDL